MKELLIFLVVLLMSNVLAGVSFFEGSFEEGYFIDAETTKVESVNDSYGENVSVDGVISEKDESLPRVSSSEESRDTVGFSIFDYRNGGVYLKTEWKIIGTLLSIFLVSYAFLRVYGGRKK